MSSARASSFWLGLSWAGALLGAPADAHGAGFSLVSRAAPWEVAATEAYLAAPAPRWNWPQIFDRAPRPRALDWSRNACAPSAGGWGLGADRRQQLRAGGVVETPFHLSLALAACYRLRALGTAVPLAASEDGYASGVSDGRRPAGYEVGVRLDYPLLERAARVGLILHLDAVEAPTPRLGRLALTAAGRPLVLQLPESTLRLGLRVSF